MDNRITAVILTKNAQDSIASCVKSVEWCSETLIIDDNSTDKTAEIASDLGAKVIVNSLSNDFAAQRNFGLEKAKGEWVLFVDADEQVSPNLRYDIEKTISKTKFNGFLIKRNDYIWGRELKHGETGDIYLVRLSKKDLGRWKGSVHEVWDVPEPLGVLKSPIVHYPHENISEFLKKINFYTSIRAQELYKKKEKSNFFAIVAYPKAKFLQNYILKRGFLDGNAGFVHAALMSFHSFLVRGKLWLLWDKSS